LIDFDEGLHPPTHACIITIDLFHILLIYVFVYSSPQIPNEGWPTWSFEKPGESKVVFVTEHNNKPSQYEVMTLKQVVEKKVAKKVGHLGNEFPEGKCPPALVAVPNEKKIYISPSPLVEELLCAAGQSENYEIVFVVTMNVKKHIVPKGVAIVSAKQFVVANTNSKPGNTSA
jgi:hypothetical protein